MKTERKLAAGILAICKKTGRILLGRRAVDDVALPGHWGVFGGTFEDKDGVPKNCAIREFKEETRCSAPYSISSEPLDIRKDNFVVYYTFVGLFDEEFIPVIDHEHCDFGWFEMDAMPDALVPGLSDTLKNRGGVIRNIIEKNK